MNSNAEKLQQHLTNQINISEDFLCALFQEREVIAKNLIDQLPEITEKKFKLIELLTQTEINILSCLKEQLGEQTTNQPEEALARLDPNNEHHLTSLLQKARDLAAECKRENQLNSQIVEASQGQVEQTLDLLLGREKHKVYSASGKTIKQGGSSLGEA